MFVCAFVMLILVNQVDVRIFDFFFNILKEAHDFFDNLSWNWFDYSSTVNQNHHLQIVRVNVMLIHSFCGKLC